MPEDKVVLKIEIPRKEYEALEALAERRGYPLVSDYIRAVVGEILSGSQAGCQPINTRELAEEIAKRLERRISDLINPFTAKIDEINRRLGDLIELLEEKTARSEEEPSQPRPRREARAERPVERGRRASAIDRLREQKIVLYSDVAWMKAPRKLFDKLEREGAIVIDAGGELVAVDPEFWDRFVEVVQEIGVSDPEEAESLLVGSLGEAGGKLFHLLLRAGLVYYDRDAGQWVVSARRQRGPASG